MQKQHVSGIQQQKSDAQSVIQKIRLAESELASGSQLQSFSRNEFCWESK